MGKSDSNTSRSIESSTQFEEVEERKPNPSLILLSSDDDVYEDPILKTEEKSIIRADIYVNSNKNPSFSSDSEVIITAVKKTEKTKEIMGAQTNVEDTEKKEENIESIETQGFVEIDTMEKSDNVVLRKLLRGPRYFDPPDNNLGNCYNCGETGHTVASCTTPKRKRPCFVCGSFEHNAKQCKQGKDCFICKKSGHRANNCPEKSSKGFQKTKLCLKCGDSGHEMFTCKNSYSPDDLKEIECYICKCFGHLCCGDYGKGATEVSCYRCGLVGHTGLDCEKSHAHVETTSTMSQKSCYKCGVEGHKARKCPTSSKKKRKRKTKLSHNLQESPNHIGVRSAPPGLGEGHKRNKTQNGHSTSYQPRNRGGWMNEDANGYYHVNNWAPPSTPQTYYHSNNSLHRNQAPSTPPTYYQAPSTPPTYYQPNHSFHGNHGANNHGYGNSFPYEGSGSNGYQHGFPRSRFGESSDYGRREYNWRY